MDDTCVCGHVYDDHSEDLECAVEDCLCFYYEEDDEDEDGDEW